MLYLTGPRASFTDAVDARERAIWIKEMDLAGAVAFITDSDDFEKKCGCKKFPLLKAVNRVFGRYHHKAEHKNCSLFYEPNASTSPTSVHLFLLMSSLISVLFVF